MPSAALPGSKLASHTVVSTSRDRAVAPPFARASRARFEAFARAVAPARWGGAATLATLFCALFGIALIADTQLAGDGCWYWYAREYLGGHRLYADLGLAQQPLYILLTALTIEVFGGSWIATRIPALVGLALFLLPIHLLAKRSGLGTWERGILVAFTFFVGIHFEAYRFDDYHVIVDGLCMVAAVLLIDLPKATDGKRQALLVGLVCGLTLVTRLNDGGVLAGAAVGLTFVLAPRRRLRLTALALASTLVTSVVVVLLTRDTLADWAHFSIVAAAGAKGGGGHLLEAPLKLPWNAAQSLLTNDGPVVGTMLLLIPLPAVFWPSAGRFGWATSLVVRGQLVLLGWLLVSQMAEPRDPIIVASAAGVWIAYVTLALLVVRVAYRLLLGRLVALRRDARFVIAIPILLWMSGSLSSGGFHFGLYFPFAFFVLLLPVAYPRLVDAFPARAALCSLLALLAYSGAVFRYGRPCSWHSYQSAPLFKGRKVVRHPLYGPMVIEPSLYGFITKICGTIEAGGGGALLSLPFPYANYYCGIEPWRGYVQTFFDTSTEKQIRDLVVRLRVAPPEWILYQRQLENLAMHEVAFNSGKPLPHRELDKLVMDKVASGEWKAAETTAYLPGSTWMLVHTRRGSP